MVRKTKKVVTKAASAIQQIITTVFDDIYLEGQKRTITGLATIPIRYIMATMLRQHGKIRNKHITAATTLSKEQWGLITLVQALFDRINKAADLVEAVDKPFSHKQLIR